MTITATAGDNCGAAVVVTPPTCSRFGRPAKCPKIDVAGPSLTVHNFPGHLVIDWNAVATDAGGNVVSVPCSTAVVPGSP
jgi:hypothetical protein